MVCAIWRKCRIGLAPGQNLTLWRTLKTLFVLLTSNRNLFSSHSKSISFSRLHFQCYFDSRFIVSILLFLKALDMFGNCQRPVFLFLVYPNICIQWQTCDNLGSVSRQSFKKIMKEKNTLFAHFLCAFRCIIKGFRSEVFYYLSEKLPLSQNMYASEGAASHKCFKLSAALSPLPVRIKFLFQQFFWVVTNSVQCL